MLALIKFLHEKIKDTGQIVFGIVAYFAIGLGVIIFLTWPFFVIGGIIEYVRERYNLEVPVVLEIVLFAIPYVGTWLIVGKISDWVITRKRY